MHFQLYQMTTLDFFIFNFNFQKLSFFLKERIDSAHETILDQSSFKDFKIFAFEVQTIANQYLAPARIKEYLGIVYDDQGGARAAKATMYYILLVSAKFLTMMTSYYSVYHGMR